jgi:hypothetical protein
MKFNKIFTLALSLLVATAAFADEANKPSPEERAKKDYSSWLPVQGDMSIGFALDPIATFVGNMFNGNLDNALGDLAGESLLNEELPNSAVSIMGTYMVTDNFAVRANVGFGLYTKKINYYVQDDAALALNDLSNAKVIDQLGYRSFSGSFALGVEYRLGKRLPIQGVFGAGLNYACGTWGANLAYGNAITEINQNPSINPNMPSTSAVVPYLPNARMLSYTSAELMHTVGAYGSVGIEWFVSPKIALGANVNLGIYYEINPARAEVYEGWNTVTEEVTKHTELVAPSSHGFRFGTENIGANLYVAFYFDTK